MSLTIAFDATPFSVVPMTGAGRYVINLLRELATLDRENRYRIFGFEPVIPFSDLWPSNFEYFSLRLDPRLGGLAREWARMIHVRRELKQGRIDLIQSNLDPVWVPKTKVRHVCMIYDVMRSSSVFRFATPHSFRMRARTKIRYSLAERADHILTISEYSKREIVRTLNVPPGKVTVTALAADSLYTPGEPDRSALEALGIGNPYCLFVGEFGRQKNEDGLIRSFLAAAVENRIDEKGALVLVGDPDRLPPASRQFVASHPMKNRIHFVGRVNETDLLNLYRGARLFVLPSLMEGFGLPVLEAMACGTPVIVSDRSSLPEVVGEAGVVISPERPETILEGIVSLWNRPEERQRLSRLGLLRAGEFSFAKTADHTLRVYRELAAEDSR